jgi:hypothetical protein
MLAAGAVAQLILRQQMVSMLASSAVAGPLRQRRDDESRLVDGWCQSQELVLN